MQFSTQEISEGFAAARGLAPPSQLRRMLRTQGRDQHATFTRLLPSPPQPIRIQRWSPQRIALWAAMAAVLAVALNPAVLFDDTVAVQTSLGIDSLACDELEPLVVEAQSVPSASMVPGTRVLPTGWSLSDVAVNDGRWVLTLDHDRAETAAMIVRLTAFCADAGARELPPSVSGVRHFERTSTSTGDHSITWYDRFPGGCVTSHVRPTNAPNGEFAAQAPQVVGLVPRASLDQALRRRSGGRLQLDPERAR